MTCRASEEIHTDPRFASGVELFNSQQFYEAGDLFEELFFEAVGGELEFIRTFLQVSVGCVHAERRQSRAAIERLQEATMAIDRVADDRGFDLASLRGDILKLMSGLPGPESPFAGDWPVIRPRTR